MHAQMHTKMYIHMHTCFHIQFSLMLIPVFVLLNYLKHSVIHIIKVLANMFTKILV